MRIGGGTLIGSTTTYPDGTIAVADNADGTDGELITWNASGVAATVPVGTAADVLTSGGVGVAPTFQTPSGGGGAHSFVQTNTFTNATTFTITQTVVADEVFYIVVQGDMTGGGNNLEPGIRINSDSAGNDYVWTLQGRDAATSVTDSSAGANEFHIMDSTTNDTLNSGPFLIQLWVTAEDSATQVMWRLDSLNPVADATAPYMTQGSGNFIGGTMTSMNFITIAGTETYDGRYTVYKQTQS